jgi:hypothetical protein
VRKICLISVFTALISLPLFSQEFKIGFETGVGHYAMKDLKKVNNDIISGLPFDAEVVSDFPVFFYYEPGFHLKIKRTGIGILYTYESTGSRISAKDYSAEYRFDMTLGSNSFGLYAGYDVWSNENYKLAVNSTFRVMFSKMKASEYFALRDSVVLDNSAYFNSKNYSLEPGITFSRSFGPYITLEGNAGYLFCFSAQPFRSLESSRYILHYSDSDKPIKPDWNGFRLGVSVYITFSE